MSVAICASAVAAAGQTVTVIGAPAGASITVLYDGNSVGTANADPKGLATVKFAAVKTGDLDVRLYSETCNGAIRILLRSPGTTLPESACARQDAGSLFSLRPVTTFVVDVTGNPASVSISQGPAPAHWLVHDAPTGNEKVRTREWEPPVQALVLSGGLGTIGLSSLSTPNCGDVAGCTAGGIRPTFGAGATYWFAPVIGIYGSVGRTSEVTAHGTGSTFNFDSTTRLDRLNVAATAGGPAGPTRIYGIGGVTFNKTRTKTSESIDAPGAATRPTQQIEIETRGWGILFGAGLEIWATRRLGMFGEFTDSTLRGADVKDGEARIDGTAMALSFGARFKLRS